MKFVLWAVWGEGHPSPLLKLQDLFLRRSKPRGLDLQPRVLCWFVLRHRTVLSTPNPVPNLVWPCQIKPGTMGQSRKQGWAQLCPHSAFLLQLQTPSSIFTSPFPSPVSRALRAPGSPSPPLTRGEMIFFCWLSLTSFVFSALSATSASLRLSLPAALCWGKRFVIPAWLGAFSQKISAGQAQGVPSGEGASLAPGRVVRSSTGAPGQLRELQEEGKADSELLGFW